MTFRIPFVFALACGLGFACGGTKPAEGPISPASSATAEAVASTPPEKMSADAAPVASSVAPAVSSAAPATADKPWKDKSRDDKLAIMKTVVMPKMKAEFQAFDAKEFKDFTCKTCHGEAAKEGKFEMPNPKLPKLNAKDGFKAHQKKHAKMLEFMMHKVVPGMADAMGVKPFDPATKEGFGCGGCHLMEH